MRERWREPADRNPLENLIREAVGDGGMYDGTLATITLTNGFEDFGAYEGWGQGYVVRLYNTRTKEMIGVGASMYLDTAVQHAVQQVKCEHDFTPLVEGGKETVLCKKCGKHNPRGPWRDGR